jgi:hypothetical protein
MEDHVDALHRLRDDLSVPNVTLDDTDRTVCACPGQIVQAAPSQVVQHDDLVDLTAEQQLVGDVGADQAAPTSD